MGQTRPRSKRIDQNLYVIRSLCMCEGCNQWAATRRAIDKRQRLVEPAGSAEIVKTDADEVSGSPGMPRAPETRCFIISRESPGDPDSDDRFAHTEILAGSEDH